jgi:signal transduction histidine kinase
MAREIHDTLAQTFTGVIVQLEAAKDLLVSRPDIVQTRLTLAADLARQGLNEARRSVRALRPEALESGSLLEALQRLIHQMTNGIPIQTSVSLEGTPYPLPGDVEENLLRIAQEALTNALRHANPQNIKIELIFETDTFYLRISDDGDGFDPQVFQASSFGLLGIQERARRIGGQFDLTSKPGQGTAIIITLPKSS